MNLREAHLISSIQTLFSNDERLIYFFFNHKDPELRASVDELLQEAQSLCRGEYLLIQAALDFWNGEGGLKLGDVLSGLDDENVLAFVRAILHWREIDIERLWNESLC